ncbi:hypothetical protein FOXB_12583 [Fusarium oxysporum f. sp. conglutinans Fo5176]|uniref:F-box domain-containing protein n=1 Tax=Fusarium oxysporum (strain Fo5176) TaxID=660025 RepID=F9G1Q1_FUSOF|nr:hypothetical protein FOXB_12583 [Fusarium oxysporum f. sp. conglutinans Fo5176]
MAPVSLLDCPDEVIDGIVELLPGSAVKASRLTSKRLNRIASPYLFPVLYISCHQLDLDVFRMVSKNPLLIGGVRELVIDDTTVPPSVRDWPTYQKVVTFPQDPNDRRDHLELGEGDTLEPRWMNGQPSKVRPSEEAWKLFNSIAEGHHDNRLAHADFDALKRALHRLKNLESLVVSNRMAAEYYSDGGAQSRVSSSPVAKLWRRFDSERKEYVPLAPRCDWHPTTQGLQDRTPVNTMDWLDDRLVYDITKNGVSNMTAVQSTYDHFFEQQSKETFKQDRAEFLFDSPSSELRILAREARVIFLALLVLEDPKLQSQLTEFRVDATYNILSRGHQPGLAITLFDQQSPFTARLGSGFAAATNITKFDLTLSNFPDGTIGDAIVEEGKVRRVFESMTLIIEHCSLRPYDKDLPWWRVTDQLTEFHDQGILQLEEGSDIDNVFESVPITDCGRNGSLQDLRQIWKYDEDGKWDRWLNAQEEEVNGMLLSGAFGPDP